ncbi:MAG: EamA/RhaT family transporter, partial [Paracoccaceae bacterium]|nr:EamA/RhaT family transporter [Paracoccaceae bacterium]
MIQAYRLAEASRVSVFEYVLLPVSAFWGYILWGQLLSWVAIMGMILIAISGLLISLFRPIQA